LVILYLPALAQTDAQKAEIQRILESARVDTERAAQQAADSQRISDNIRTFSNFVLKSDRNANEGFKAANTEANSLAESNRSQIERAGALASEIEITKEQVVVAEEGKRLEELRSKALELSKRAAELSASAESTAASAAALNSRLAREPGSDDFLASADPQSLGGKAGSLGCVKAATCTPVSVFFGTDRGEEDRADRVHFNAMRAGALVVGRAVVTVPRANRKKGEINLPSWWDLLRFKNPWRIDPTSHFTIPDGGVTVMTPQAFIAAAREHLDGAGTHPDHAFVFVHGYNNGFDDGLYRAAQISYDLGENDKPFGTAFVYSWPSAGAFQDYNYDFTSARRSVKQLERFLDLVIDETQAKHVHLIAHSMGNWPLVTALAEVVAKHSGNAKISQIILAAPDIDAGEFEEIAKTMVPGAKTITLYASSGDRALLASRNANGAARAGDIASPDRGPAAIVPGIDSIDVSALSTDMFGLNHNTYVESKELMKDISDLMLSGTRPPDQRNASFRVNGTLTRPFWTYEKE
jgi:esterase/lipase superfamily enzyme